ncbi:putative metalloendopeptidase [Natronospira proteinivora]|uniref:Metalloendopeptidase n=1 Tax=Natronospira proteinivora TaxID=1807133 RepID=A0ABT1GAE3_9GAMM|nr:M13 family metallopeptidase [Natronospira proteinivora]MCP1728022.1 putative metalloendopeptidase [Natronospira proteinivora]
MSRHLLVLLCASVLFACGQEEMGEGASSTDQEAPRALGVDLENMDRDVRPQDDFFRFVNGGWMARTDIPSDRARYGSFDELREQAERDLRELVDEVSQAEGVETGSPEQMIRDFYISFMDEERLETLGLEPLQPLLSKVTSIEDRDELKSLLAELPTYGVNGPFSFFVRQDARDSEQYISYISQSGLGLPERDYYLDEANEDVRQAYLEHIAEMFELMGHESPSQAADSIMALESELAEHHWTRVENRDPVATYNRKEMASLKELAPGMNWSEFLDSLGVEAVDAVVVRQPDYLSEADRLLSEHPLDDWQTYLQWRVLSRYAQYLSSDFADARFDFSGRVLQGLEEQEPRWERAIQTLNSVVGFQLGKLYVERHYDEEASERMAEMVDNLMIAFQQTLEESPWMSPDTRDEALAKLEDFNTKIGYPDEWRSYEGLEVDPEDLLGNVMRSRAYEHERMLNHLGEEVDRDEWFMTPQTVNAYYSPSMTEIVFPAAILQPPFFDVNADDAINYGAIGAVIGHEISHGFDDSGRQVDGDGNLRDWWSEGSEEEFQDRSQVLVDQFSAEEPLEGVNIDGRATLGENIADHGGLRVAWRAYQLSLDGEAAPEIEGFTGEQRFFLGWGQIWRIQFRDEALRQHLQTRPHSPGEFRVNTTLPNIPGFYEAFDVSPDDEMYLPEEERANIW